MGFYGQHGDEIVTEEDGPGGDFLANVCKEWEESSQPVEDFGVQRIIIRTGVVLSIGEGALLGMMMPFRLFMRGWLGSGKQWVPSQQ